MPSPDQRLRRRIAAQGSISVADFMAEANAHYYGSRDPLGAAGDFITAPEISQMFGELVGIWIADLWSRAGRPLDLHFVELGPGRGTLARDALRAMSRIGLAPPVELVETSPALREVQAANLPQARWHDRITDLDGDGPLIVVANEFFDALPITQHDCEGRELRVRFADGRYVRDAADMVIESSPAALEAIAQVAGEIARRGGGALIIDYSREPGSVGDTLQAVSAHERADPWIDPGSRDLTALVDFGALGERATSSGVRVHGPTGQGDWLDAMGIGLRAAALARRHPDRTEEIATARDRLTAPGQMGRLFKVMALTAPDWPEPAGFMSAM